MAAEGEIEVRPRIDVLTWGATQSVPAGVVQVELPRELPAAARAVEAHLEGDAGPWLLLWDPVLGPPPIEVAEALIAERTGDVWHAGPLLGLGDLPEEHDYIHPSHPFVLDPPRGAGGTCWRLSLAAALVRTDALRAVGGIDAGFHGTSGAGLELGRRLIEQGALVRSAPVLVAARGARVEALDEHDRFLFLLRTFGAKWVRYAAARRAIATRRPWRTLCGLRAAAVTHRGTPAAPAGLVERAPVVAPDDPSITVVLPTLGRYELLRPLLEQLTTQTIAPLEVLVVDQNDPERRDHDLYRSFEGRGVRVIWQTERGQWISRNEAVQQARGEWIAFIDDDSEIEPTFLAEHLEGIARYGAELSTGASLAVVGAPVPENYAFYRVADQWDSGNGMCRRDLFAEMGLFDEQFDRQRRGDAEFGLRVQLAGGLVIHNPRATRVHLKADEGGLRSYGSWDGFRHKDRSGPLPVPSMLYYTARYHSPRQRREDLFLGLVNGMVPYHLKRRATPGQWARFALVELVNLPSTRRRVRRSQSLARAMVAEGPRIPELRG
ncbi:MAG: glycosyltransferase [Acidimicrobiales bacterium]|nr:glycosyltransferase [Acidimicrobiales bacterium]